MNNDELDKKYGKIVAEFGDFTVRSRRPHEDVHLFKRGTKGEQWQGSFPTVKEAQTYSNVLKENILNNFQKTALMLEGKGKSVELDVVDPKDKDLQAFLKKTRSL